MNKLFGVIFLYFIASFANATVDSAPVTGAGDYLKIVLTLIFIVGLIFACAWLVRRMSGGVGMNQRHIQVLSVMPMGTREKLMIVKAVDDYLLLGVTPTTINTLHQFEGPVDLSEPMNASPFADRLKGLLKGLESDPLASHKKNSNNSESNNDSNS